MNFRILAVTINDITPYVIWVTPFLLAIIGYQFNKTLRKLNKHDDYNYNLSVKQKELAEGLWISYLETEKAVKSVLPQVDFNVPFDKEEQKEVYDKRIKISAESYNELMESYALIELYFTSDDLMDSLNEAIKFLYNYHSTVLRYIGYERRKRKTDSLENHMEELWTKIYTEFPEEVKKHHSIVLNKTKNIIFSSELINNDVDHKVADSKINEEEIEE
jgi:hypothetical protein